jgi:hypothetical protein
VRDFGYAMNVGTGAGDSDGWQITLKSIAARSDTGFKYGELFVGFPGRNILPQILDTSFGSRWLGVLAIASLITEEYRGGDQLHDLLKRAAIAETREYILDKEQTERMWIMSRELFLDTSVQRQFLRIVSSCKTKCHVTFMGSVFPTMEAFFTPTMLAAFRIWDLKAKDGTGRKLCAQGSTGMAHLILYLTVVCGFHVTAQLEYGEVSFGDEQRLAEVFIVADREIKDEWVTGYFMDDCSIEDSVRHVLQPAAELTLPNSRQSTVAPRHLSTYTPRDEDINSPGAVNVMDLQIWKDKLEKTQALHSISTWLKSYIHAIMLTGLTSSEAREHEGKTRHRRQAVSHGLKNAIKLLDPGLIQKSDLGELLDNIREDKQARSVSHPYNLMSGQSIEQLCSCRPQDTKGKLRHVTYCDLEHLVEVLEDFAWKLWVMARMDHNSQRILRDVGPNAEWDILNALHIQKSLDETSRYVFPSAVRAKALMHAVSLRLTGRPMTIKMKNVLGIVAGGAVIGMKGNEAQSVHQDTGHCFYIIPGAMETPERRIAEIYQDAVLPGKGQWGNCLELDSFQTPLDRFGEAKYGHVIQVRGDTAAIKALLSFGTRTMQIDLLNAIDSAGDLIHWEGCLGECAKGKLTEEEVKKVRVTDVSNYGVVVPQPHPRKLPDGRVVLDGPPASEVLKLSLVLANQNMLVQRAIVSHGMLVQRSVTSNESEAPVYVIQRGNCVHCAIRDALMRKADILLD